MYLNEPVDWKIVTWMKVTETKGVLREMWALFNGKFYHRAAFLQPTRGK